MTRTPLSLAALASLLLALPSAVALAGKEPDPEEHENHMKQVDPLEVGDLHVDIEGVHCQEGFAFAKAVVRNDGSDYVLIREEEIVFDVGGRKVAMFDGEKRKPVIVEPHGKSTRTLKVKGDGGFHVESFDLDLSGFYLAPSVGQTQSAPDFQLPASKNNFDAGPFRCSLQKLKQETDQTIANFECSYEGDSVAFIDPTRLAVRYPSKQGTEETVANVDRKAARKMIQPGGKMLFNAVFEIPPRFADMQFTTMNIVWADTFTESPLTPIDLGTVGFELDEAKTAEQNQ